MTLNPKSQRQKQQKYNNPNICQANSKCTNSRAIGKHGTLVTECEICKTARLNRYRDKQRKLVSEGKCTQCKTKLPKDYKFKNCQKCNGKYLEKLKKLEAAGKCKQCGIKLPEDCKLKRCKKCQGANNERHKKFEEKYKQEKRCRRCTIALPLHRQDCSRCDQCQYTDYLSKFYKLVEQEGNELQVQQTTWLVANVRNLIIPHCQKTELKSIIDGRFLKCGTNNILERPNLDHQHTFGSAGYVNGLISQLQNFIKLAFGDKFLGHLSQKERTDMWNYYVKCIVRAISWAQSQGITFYDSELLKTEINWIKDTRGNPTPAATGRKSKLFKSECEEAHPICPIMQIPYTEFSPGSPTNRELEHVPKTKTICGMCTRKANTMLIGVRSLISNGFTKEQIIEEFKKVFDWLCSKEEPTSGLMIVRVDRIDRIKTATQEEEYYSDLSDDEFEEEEDDEPESEELEEESEPETEEEDESDEEME